MEFVMGFVQFLYFQLVFIFLSFNNDGDLVRANENPKNSALSSQQKQQQKRVPVVSANDVTALISCHNEYFPNTGEPITMGFPVLESMDMSMEEVDEWMLNCLKRKAAPQMETVLREHILTTVNELNKPLVQSWLNILYERSNLTLAITTAPNKKAMKKQFHSLEVTKKKLDALRIIFRIQRESYVNALAKKLFANTFLIESVEEQIKNERKSQLDTKRYRKHLDQMDKEAINAKFLLQDKAENVGVFKGVFNYTDFEHGLNVILSIINKITIGVDAPSNSTSNSTTKTLLENWWTIENAPKYGRTLYLVRHAERMDNIRASSLKNTAWVNDTLKNPLGLRFDNSPLSDWGKQQADTLGPRFKDIDIDHIFASPMDRTMDTATRLLALKNGTLQIKVEPGIIERLDECDHPPSYWSVEELAERFPLVDPFYAPVFNKEMLAKLQQMGNPGEEDHPVQEIATETLHKILDKYEGNTFVFVSHGAPIGALHKAMTAEWTYVAQASVSKFVELGEPGSKQFRLEYSSNTEHFWDEHRHNTQSF